MSEVYTQHVLPVTDGGGELSVHGQRPVAQGALTNALRTVGHWLAVVTDIELVLRQSDGYSGGGAALDDICRVLLCYAVKSVRGGVRQGRCGLCCGKRGGDIAVARDSIGQVLQQGGERQLAELRRHETVTDFPGALSHLADALGDVLWLWFRGACHLYGQQVVAHTVMQFTGYAAALLLKGVDAQLGLAAIAALVLPQPQGGGKHHQQEQGTDDEDGEAGIACL